MSQRDFTLARCDKHQSDYAIDAETHQGMCPDCRKELPPDAVPEYGWVITWYVADRLQYFNGYGWSQKPQMACRFARQKDALMFNQGMLDNAYSVEHYVWIGEAFSQVVEGGL